MKNIKEVKFFMVRKLRFSNLRNRVRSLKYRTPLNKVFLSAKINNTEPKNINSRRRKRIKRIILFATLTVAIGGICYYRVPLKAKLLTIWAKLVKTQSNEPAIDSTIQPKNRSQYYKVALLAVAILGAVLINNSSDSSIDKSEIAVTSSRWKRGPIEPDPPFVLIAAIIDFIIMWRGTYDFYRLFGLL